MRAHYIKLTVAHTMCFGAHTYLNLQQVIAADALVVHLVVRVISITTVLVLNESEPRQN